MKVIFNSRIVRLPNCNSFTTGFTLISQLRRTGTYINDGEDNYLMIFFHDCINNCLNFHRCFKC